MTGSPLRFDLCWDQTLKATTGRVCARVCVCVCFRHNALTSHLCASNRDPHCLTCPVHRHGEAKGLMCVSGGVGCQNLLVSCSRLMWFSALFDMDSLWYLKVLSDSFMFM